MVIPAHNEERYLPSQLDALLRQEWSGDWEVIVVDNGSTDGTADVVAEYAKRSDRVRYLAATEKADWSYALNEGVRASEAEAVAFCDADDIVRPGWLATMAEGLAIHQVVTGPNLLDQLNPPWLAESRGRSGEQPEGTYFGLFPLIRGNNFGVRREVWPLTGPLAEDFAPRGVVADQEFSARCWLRGVTIVGLPGAAVDYRYREDARALWSQGFAYGLHRPKVARILKDAGRPGPPGFGGWKSWVILVIRLPTIISRTGRARWAWIASNRLGQAVGSVRYRTLMV